MFRVGMDNIRLADIEGAITRTTAMLNMGEKWGVAEDTMNYYREQIRDLWNQKQELLGMKPQPDYERLALKAEIYRTMKLDDPDQGERVNWWAD
jgi:hypothetical protein